MMVIDPARITAPARQLLSVGALPNYSLAPMRSDRGTLIVRFTAPSTLSSRMTIVSAADVGTSNNWWEFGVDSDARLYVEFNNAGTIHRVKAPTVIEVSTAYTVSLIHDGVDYFMRLNGAEENPLVIEDSSGSCAWLGDVAGSDNLVIGATIHSGGTVRQFTGTISKFEIYDWDITQ